MQGDYMALRFSLSDSIKSHLSPKQRKVSVNAQVTVTVDAQHRGVFKSLDSTQQLASNEIRLDYRIRNTQSK
ncbi:MAG: hypothetical protein Q9M36_09735 [Sulfurovum sp.]|nr:hypothetical protein [Sulfurovum sp.]